MPRKIIQIDNTYKKYKEAMKSVGFTEDGFLQEELDIQEALLDKAATIQDAKFTTTVNRLKRWENKLRKLLRDPLPKALWHKKRNANRQFPHMVSGAMKDSLEVDLEQTKKLASWVYTLTLQVDGGGDGEYADHATLTNMAANSTRNVKWKHWVDDVFGDTEHSKRIVSASTLMRQYLFEGL